MLGVRQLRSAGQRLNERSIYSGFSQRDQHSHLRFCRRCSYLRGSLRGHSLLLGVRQLRSVGQRDHMRKNVVLNNKQSIYSGFCERHKHCNLRFCRSYSYLRGALRRHSQMLGKELFRSVGQRRLSWWSLHNRHSIYSGFSEQPQHCHLRFWRRLSYLRGALRRHSQMLGVR